MAIKNKTIEKILQDSDVISDEKLKEALETSQEMDRPLSEILIEKNLVKEKELSSLISQYFGVEYVDLTSKKIDDKVLELVNEDLARSTKVIPFEKEEDTLYLGMRDPKDLGTIDLIRKKTSLNIKPFYISRQGLASGLNQYQKNLKKQFKEIVKEVTGSQLGEKKLEEVAKEVPIIRALETILKYAAAKGASDVHFELMENKLMIRSRIDGVLRDTLTLPISMHPALVARVKILANLKIDEHRVPQDGRFNFDMGQDQIALRVSIIPGFHGENVVLRLLDESARPMTLSELGLTGRNKEIVEKVIKQPNGMVLATGPTGSGKTTTLYSILNILNTPGVKICTIEDPVEYKIKRVTQMQVKPDIGMTFAKGLRSLLRHDPDNIMVGEIRDHETAEIAIHSALTGHLVMSTLHTNSAAAAIPRLVDMDVEPYLVSSTFNVVIAQRLVRKICQNCIEEYKPDKKLIKRLKKMVDKIDGKPLEEVTFYHGKGCESCEGSGYQGRVGIYEVLENNEEISSLILERASSDDILKAARKDGFTSMMEDGLFKTASGQTTVEEVLRATRESV